MPRKPVPLKLGGAGSRPDAAAPAPRALDEIKTRQPIRRRLRARSVAILLVLAVAGGAYFAYDGYRMIRLSRTVRQALAARRIEEARKPLRHWLAIRPGSGEAFYYKAWAAMAADQPGEAAAAIERAGKLGFDPALLDCLRAIGQSRSERFTEAEPVLEQAFRKQFEPQDMIAKELARIYLASYRLEKAAGPIERWKKLAPEDPEPYVWSNEVLARADSEPANLILNYRAALERNPKLDKARLGLAQQLSKARRFDEAEQEFLTYLKSNPNDSTAQLGLGRNAFQQGDLDVARRYFESAVKANPRQADALKELSQIDIRLGRFQQACEALERLTRIDPFDQDAHYSYGQALRLAGDNQRAQVELETAARLRKETNEIVDLKHALLKDPNDLNACFRVTKWLFDHGHLNEGLSWTKEILRREPRHVPTHRLLAEYYEKNGDVGLANFHRTMAVAGQESGR
jgi:tetratricopeptide (TPR) repeat protein